LLESEDLWVVDVGKGWWVLLGIGSGSGRLLEVVGAVH